MSREPCTLGSEARDFPEWHHGRPRFAVWAIAVDDAAVHARLAALRDALRPLLLPGYARQPHVTVQICGFPVAVPARCDDFGPRQLQAQVEAATRLGLAPWRLAVGGAFTFASAACLAVHDASGTVQRLRAAWPGHDPTPYVPHVTAGLYARVVPLAEVQRRLAPLADAPPIELEVRALDWMVYDSRVVAGPLHTALRLDLATGLTRGTPEGVFTPPPD